LVIFDVYYELLKDRKVKNYVKGMTFDAEIWQRSCKAPSTDTHSVVLLLIPSIFGFLSTRINYDILSYLPSDIETMKGQDIMLDEFGKGGFFAGNA